MDTLKLRRVNRLSISKASHGMTSVIEQCTIPKYMQRAMRQDHELTKGLKYLGACIIFTGCALMVAVVHAANSVTRTMKIPFESIASGVPRKGPTYLSGRCMPVRCSKLS